jgi:myo-inositol-1(or 4)-monophosphatase
MIAEWARERDVATQAAREAGRLLLERRGRAAVSRKGVNDLVTDVDRAAQELLRQRLLRAFPDDGFLGEEDAHANVPGASGRRWIVDPIDGTTNYVHGFPMFCVSVALEARGRLSVGVIHDPCADECFAGSTGGGAACNGKPLQVSSWDRMDDALVSAGFPADVMKSPASIDAFLSMTRQGWAVRRLGSAALAAAYVAAGRLDVFWAHRVQPWDIAAGVVLVREAGGQATLLDGRTPYEATRTELLATNGLLHPALTAELAGK